MNQNNSYRNSGHGCGLHPMVKTVFLISAVAIAIVGQNAAHAQDETNGPVSASIRSADPVPQFSGIAVEDEQAFDVPQAYDWQPGLAADCGFGCPPTWRVRGEYLLYNREGESGVSQSTAFQLGDFDYEKGGRLTVGRKFDCAIGWELVYMGSFDWVQSASATGIGTLNTNLGANGVNLSAFNGANFHQQTHSSQLDSFEASQKWWGWDVITTSAGVRYVNIEEQLSLISVDANGDVGSFAVETDNMLVGPQIGLEMLFPIGNWSFDTGLKGALFANFGDSTTRLTNAGVTQINNTAEDVEFAALVEGGSFMRYAVTPRIIARVGYEYLWIYGLGIAAEQLENPVGASTGRGFDGQGDTFYHGFSGGVEVIW